MISPFLNVLVFAAYRAKDSATSGMSLIIPSKGKWTKGAMNATVLAYPKFATDVRTSRLKCTRKQYWIGPYDTRPTKTVTPMTDEFTKKRRSNPDFELESYITGVRIGNTGKVHWEISLDEGMDKLLAADIFEKAAEVLRTNNRRVRPPPCRSKIPLWRIRQAVKRALQRLNPYERG